TDTQNIDKADGKSCNPTTSVPTGATVVVKVGATAPPTRAKKMRTPKLLAKIQITREKRPARKVQTSEVLIRPKLSLTYPITGRPRPPPRLNIAPRIEPWDTLS